MNETDEMFDHIRQFIKDVSKSKKVSEKYEQGVRYDYKLLKFMHMLEGMWIKAVETGMTVPATDYMIPFNELVEAGYDPSQIQECMMERWMSFIKMSHKINLTGTRK